jgi:hypothetical protein
MLAWGAANGSVAIMHSRLLGDAQSGGVEAVGVYVARTINKLVPVVVKCVSGSTPRL